MRQAASTDQPRTDISKSADQKAHDTVRTEQVILTSTKEINELIRIGEVVRNKTVGPDSININNRVAPALQDSAVTDIKRKPSTQKTRSQKQFDSTIIFLVVLGALVIMGAMIAYSIQAVLIGLLIWCFAILTGLIVLLINKGRVLKNPNHPKIKTLPYLLAFAVLALLSIIPLAVISIALEGPITLAMILASLFFILVVAIYLLISTILEEFVYKKRGVKE